MKTIFLIDDDADDREIFQIALNELDVKTNYIEAQDGQAALDLIANSSFTIPDIIFVDLNMPRVNGLEFLTIVRQMPSFKNIPIYIYSTSSVAQEKEKCTAAGASGFITKHYTLNGLTEELKQILSLK